MTIFSKPNYKSLFNHFDVNVFSLRKKKVFSGISCNRQRFSAFGSLMPLKKSIQFLAQCEVIFLVFHYYIKSKYASAEQSVYSSSHLQPSSSLIMQHSKRYSRPSSIIQKSLMDTIVQNINYCWHVKTAYVQVT